jgi:hypothetical protein
VYNIKYSRIIISIFLLIVFSISVSASWEVKFSDNLGDYSSVFIAAVDEGAIDGYGNMDVLQQPAPPSGAYIQMRTRVDDNSLAIDYRAEPEPGVVKTWEIRKLIKGIGEEDETNEEDTLTWELLDVPSNIELKLIDYGTDSGKTTVVETIDLKENSDYSFDVTKTGPGTFRYIDVTVTNTEEVPPEDDGNSGNSGSSGGSGGSRTYTPPKCDAEWECEEWSLCSEEGKQTRVCTEKTICGTDKPVDKRNCYYYREKEEVVEEKLPELISEGINEDAENTDSEKESLDKITGFSILNNNGASPLIGVFIIVFILIIGLSGHFIFKKN